LPKSRSANKKDGLWEGREIVNRQGKGGRLLIHFWETDKGVLHHAGERKKTLFEGDILIDYTTRAGVGGRRGHFTLARMEGREGRF